MPAFGCNRFTIPFLETVLQKEVVVSGDGSEEDPFVYEHVGFRFSDRIVSALDRFLGQVIARLASDTYPGLKRFAYIYPLVGGLDWTHSMNLADEEGGYEKYKITWTGTAHNENGILGGTGATGALGGVINGENWIFKTFGFYSCTNNAGVEKSMNATAYRSDGYTFQQGIHPRYSDGNAYFDNCLYSGPSSGGNRLVTAVGDSLGLYGVSRELNWPGWPHLLRSWKRNVNLAYEGTTAQGFGGQGGGEMIIYPTNRRLAFVFATKNNCFFNMIEYPAFADMVQRFQVGLARAV